MPKIPLAGWTLLYSLLICSVIVTAGLGRLPVKAILRHVPWGDKAGHFILIGFLAYLINLSLGAAGDGRLWKANLCLFVLVLGEEISQIWMAYRAFEVADLVADLAGISTFALLARWQMSRRRSSHSQVPDPPQLPPILPSDVE